MVYEDFQADYTEVDEGNDITLTDAKCEWVEVGRDVTSYVYKDHGIGHFDDFTHDVELQNSTSSGALRFVSWALANAIDEYMYFAGGPYDLLCIYNSSYNGTCNFALKDIVQGTADSITTNTNELYYCTIARIDTAATMKMYTDSNRTILMDTLSIVCKTDAYRYLYACMSRDDGSSNASGCGFSQNFNIQEKEELSDAVSISDSITFKYSIFPTDAISIADTPIFKHSIFIGDDMSISDSISTVLTHLITLSDSVNISDGIAFKHSLNLTDTINITDAIVYKHIITLADNMGISDSILLKHLINLADSIGITDSSIYKHLLSLADSFAISDSIIFKHSVFFLDNLSISDAIATDMIGQCGQIFNIHSATYDIYLPIPERGGESGKLNNEIKLFDFWTTERDTINIGISDEPIILSGTIFTCTDNESAEMAIIATKFSNLHAIADTHEEITITELGDCFDAVYIIKNFRYATIRRSPYAFIWSLTLEYVREI